MKELGVSETVVIRLMSDLYNKGCNVYMDNWCLSFKLFAHLEKNGTVGCETAMKKGFFSAIVFANSHLNLGKKFSKEWQLAAVALSGEERSLFLINNLQSELYTYRKLIKE